MMNKKYLIVIEIIWIATGILSILAGIKYAITECGPKIFIFILLALVSFLFAWLRHRQRKKS